MREPPDAAELHRRRLLVARAALASFSGASPEARAAAQRVAAAEAAERLKRAIEAAEAASMEAIRDRQREPARLTNPWDPGAPKVRWEREGATAQPPQPNRRHGRRKKRLRPWKSPRRKAQLSAAVLDFSKQHAWTPARSQALATRIKKNDAVIAHPRAADAALRQLSLWSQAAVRRACRARGWTLADEAARRHIAFWATLEDFARPRAYLRPRQFRSSGGAVRYVGAPKYGLAVVGWTQSALAIALSGPATTDAGADPIDVKTVQRHTELAELHGALQRVVRDPSAEAELRGRPTESNPRGWPINAYWIPAPGMMKPGFTGQHFDSEGPINLEQALALELIARAKRPRRLREQAQPPPPPAA